MKDETKENIGDSLLAYAKGAEFSAQRGAVIELFPYIFQASKRLSARAISSFLQEKHGVKISYVTLGKALRQPEKYWNLFYDSIEPYAWTVGEAHEKPLKYFMSEPDKFQEMLETKPCYLVDDIDDKHSWTTAMGEYDEALRILDDKWFCFDAEVLEEGRHYLLFRFSEKPSAKTDEN